MSREFQNIGSSPPGHSPEQGWKYSPRPKLKIVPHPKYKDEAQKLFTGQSTIEEVTKKFGPRETEKAIKQTHALRPQDFPEEISLDTFAHRNSELIAAIPEMLHSYWKEGRTQSEDDMFIEMLNTLKQDDRFNIILSQYEPLMAINSGEIEMYEGDAMKKYYELYHKKVSLQE